MICDALVVVAIAFVSDVVVTSMTLVVVTSMLAVASFITFKGILLSNL